MKKVGLPGYNKSSSRYIPSLALNKVEEGTDVLRRLSFHIKKNCVSYLYNKQRENGIKDGAFHCYCSIRSVHLEMV